MAGMFEGGLFKFIENTTLRKALEVVVSSLPGAIVFFLFIAGTGLLNIYSSLAEANEIFTATYLPIICLLPIVIGVIGPLILEKIRDAQKLSLRASVMVSFISAFLGSFVGAVFLIIAGVADYRPFGGLLSEMLPSSGRFLLAFVLLIAISAVLAVIGGALIVVLLNKAER